MLRKLNLCLHAGGVEANWDDVCRVATPQATETWCPIPHNVFVDTVLETLGRNGLQVVNNVHALWAGGNRYFGAFQLSNGDAHDDYALVVGLRNSHDKTFPAGVACGSGVFVCDNLAFSGEVRLSRKHTSRIRDDLPRLINAAIGRLGTMQASQDQRIAAYKDRGITDLQAHDLIIRAVDADALPMTHVPHVLQGMARPLA